MKKTNIVFLDAGTLDFGDISLREIFSAGRFKPYFKTSPEQMAARCKNAEVAIINKCALRAETLSKLKKLRLITVAATGVNNVDLDAARSLGIAVANVPGYSTESVVQATFAFLLAIAGNLVKYNKASHDGSWSRSPFFVLGAYPLMEIHGKTLGIVGYGAIGKRVAEVARAFGMNVMVAKIPGRAYASGPARYGLLEVAKKADFLSVHAPLTPLTRNLINERVIRKMKSSAAVLNLARGGIVDEAALKRALQQGRLAGAASDVLTQEPPPSKHILLKAPNMLLTPHVAWATRESRVRLVHELSLNIQAFLKGRKRNRVV